jgi:hypothetical protein
MRTMLRSAGALSIALGMLVSSVAVAESPRPSREDVMGATPDTVNAEWVTGVSADGGAKGESIEMTDFAYYSFRNWWDQDLSDVRKIRASFLAGSGTVNAGGSPRFSLALDANGDGDFEEPTGSPTDEDVYVYLDPAHCSDLTDRGWSSADFTGDETDCTIYDSTGASYTSDEDGTAWSKLVEAYPDAVVWFLYLIQDATTGTNYVDRIMLDNAFFTKQP